MRASYHTGEALIFLFLDVYGVPEDGAAIFFGMDTEEHLLQSRYRPSEGLHFSKQKAAAGSKSGTQAAVKRRFRFSCKRGKVH